MEHSKSFSHFSAKNGNVFAYSTFGNGNIMLINDIVSFEQLNPDYLL